MGACILERYVPEGASPEITDGLVACYRSVFAAQPWGEWMKCPKCGVYWGVEDEPLLAKDSFTHCDAQLVEFWPQNQVEADIKHEVSGDASCWVARDSGKVIGFSWAYPTSWLDLENKLGIPLRSETLGANHGTVAYLDEVGVLPQYRGQKLAKELKGLVLQDMFSKGARAVVGRVRKVPTPSVTYLWWTQKLGYSVVGDYPPQDGRVVLARAMLTPPAAGNPPAYG